MSPKDFRKISHPEQKISTVQLTDHRRTHAHTDKCKSRADPTRGGSAKNGGGRKTKKWKCPYNIQIKGKSIT